MKSLYICIDILCHLSVSERGKLGVKTSKGMFCDKVCPSFYHPQPISYTLKGIKYMFKHTNFSCHPRCQYIVTSNTSKSSVSILPILYNNFAHFCSKVKFIYLFTILLYIYESRDNSITLSLNRDLYK